MKNALGSDIDGEEKKTDIKSKKEKDNEEEEIEELISIQPPNLILPLKKTPQPQITKKILPIK